MARSRAKPRSSWFDPSEPADTKNHEPVAVTDEDMPEKVIAHDPPIVHVTAPDVTDRLPFTKVSDPRPVAIIGVHGGAGATTLAGCEPELFVDCGSAWPQTNSKQACILVARTYARGLHALQTALRQWAAAETPSVDLLGVVLIADAPGKLPKPLKELMQVVTSGAPRTWHVPWDPAMRFNVDNAVSMRGTKKLVRNLKTLVTE